EQDLPGANTAGFNTTIIGSLPLETSLTMNHTWGFNITDTSYKPVPELIQTLVRAAGNDANLLLNIGPRPDGTIQPDFVERLKEMGEWVEVCGESVYGTRGGPISPRHWGVTTQRGDTVYVHVLDRADPVLSIPSVGGLISRAYMLASGEPVTFTQEADGVSLRLPGGGANELDHPDPVAQSPDRVVVLVREKGMSPD
ncbi:MAG: alpha-L-fucosidase, partial [Longimicrobiales bacterium]|nr:alpha-L-fucosidase [Longimicrobiales bacterium]